MKKLLVLVYVCAVLVLSSSAAMAEDAGHGGHVAPEPPDASKFVDVKIASSDIKIATPDTGSIEVQSVTPILETGITTITTSGKFYVSDAGKKPSLLGGFTLDIKHKEEDKNAAIDIALPSVQEMGLKEVPAFAWIQDKDQTTGEATDSYSRYSIESTTGGLTVKGVVLSKHFSEANVLVGNETNTSTHGGGSSGCNAAALPIVVLLTALPLLCFRRK
ncbi:hypothetical protein [Cloacibacillus sp.]|uniref:hypothetical protein n=1 Tax=Cloacibacillus sp. TaxID=2049023 RepID=UPI0025C2627B|nr:hypothetical protein [Cloacibacillus sp.]MCC8056886.1 hypothetical protein [Cloacibacillus sp.]